MKPIHVWKFTLLSLVPFLGYYPFVKLKKTRKILLINIPLGLANLFVLFFVNHYLGLAMSYIIIPLIDAIYVYHWSEEYNQKSQSNVKQYATFIKEDDSDVDMTNLDHNAGVDQIISNYDYHERQKQKPMMKSISTRHKLLLSLGLMKIKKK